MAAPAAHLGEYRAAREAVAWADSSDREQLRVVGPDRVSFVQGMVTNDVAGLSPGQSCYATALTAKGAMVADLRVLVRADEVVLDTNPGQGQPLLQHLLKYLISEEAELAPAPDLAVVSAVGPGAGALVAGLGSLATMPNPLGGIDALIPRTQLEVVRVALAAVPRLGSDTEAVLRVEAGVPRFPFELTSSTIPLEANLERALHYQKGCYLGQEVIARGTYRGQMNKKLVGLLLGGAEPEPGAELRRGERKAGWLTSVVRSIKREQVVALGYVHRDFVNPGTELTLAEGGGAMVCSLPF